MADKSTKHHGNNIKKLKALRNEFHATRIAEIPIFRDVFQDDIPIVNAPETQRMAVSATIQTGAEKMYASSDISAPTKPIHTAAAARGLEYS